MKVKYTQNEVLIKPLVIWLRQFGLKVNNFFVKEKLESHPFFPSAYAITDFLLSEFKIETIALDFKKKGSLPPDLPLPLLTFFPVNTVDNVGTKLIIIKDYNDRYVTFQNQSGDLKEVSWGNFQKDWTGLVLAKTMIHPNSGEKDYVINKTKLIVQFLIKGLILSILAYLFLINSTKDNNFLPIILGVTYLIGIYFSVSLLKKEYKNNDNVELLKICKSVGSDCESVLDSKYSKFFGLYSWSELGLGYFGGGMLLCVLYVNNFTTIISFLFLLNIPTLFFSMFSLFSQKFIIKKWCLICLMTLTLFIIQFICFYFLHDNYYSINNSYNYLLLLLIVLIPFFTWLLLKPLIASAYQGKSYKKALYEIKYKAGLFDKLKAKISPLPKEIGLKILEEGTDNRLVIITNPICRTCSRVHKELKFLIEMRNSILPNLEVQIVFGILTENKDSKSYKLVKHLIQLFLTDGKKVFLKAIEFIYENREISLKKLQQKFPCIYSNETEVSSIISNHNNWCVKNNIKGTPAVIINDYGISNIYTLKDLRFFTSNLKTV